jgi:hypothetical protein
MSPKLRFYLGGILVLVVLNFTCRRAHAQESTTNAQAPAVNTNIPKLFGEFKLTSNFVEHGVSFSNSSWAMQPSLGYQWLNARVGLWGSNVQFPGSTESLNLRLFAWYKIIFSGGNDLKIRLDMNKYFASSSRNAEVVTFDLNMTSDHFVVESNPNWFGTMYRGLWLGYERDWKVFWGLDYKLSTGYTMIESGPYSSYFDTKTGFGYKYSDIYYELLMNFNSGGGQFRNGIGDLAFFFQFGAQF